MPFEEEEGRRFKRFHTDLKAQYYTLERPGSWQECSISDVSRKGMKILLQYKLNLGTQVVLEIYVPEEKRPVTVKGKIQWVEAKEGSFICGCELSEMLDEVTWSKLT